MGSLGEADAAPAACEQAKCQSAPRASIGYRVSSFQALSLRHGGGSSPTYSLRVGRAAGFVIRRPEFRRLGRPRAVDTSRGPGLDARAIARFPHARFEKGDPS